MSKIFLVKELLTYLIKPCTKSAIIKCSKKCLHKDTKAINNESRSREIEHLNDCKIPYPTKQESESDKNMISWVNCFRKIKRSTKKSGKKRHKKAFVLS